MAVFDSATAQEWASEGKDVVLVRRETNPDDLGGMIAAVGVLTARGGKTSHAAVVARGMGRTCVVGAEALDIDVVMRSFRADGHVVHEGDVVAIDGSSGEVFLGDVAVAPSPVSRYLDEGLDTALAAAPDDDTRDLVRAVDRLLRHADSVRRLHVHANADTADDAARARRLGAQGVGLCRTEHMFLGERRVLVERVVLATDDTERQARRRRGSRRRGWRPGRRRSAARRRRFRPRRRGRSRAAPAAAGPARHRRSRRGRGR